MTASLIAQIIFAGLMLVLLLYSLMMVYALVRFGKSKILALALSAFYLFLMTSLYAAAQANFNNLALPQF